MQSFDPFAEARVKHHQCGWCDLMTSGPHQGKNPGWQAAFADDEHVYRGDEPEVEPLRSNPQEHQISHDVCPDCYERTIAEWRSHRRPPASGGDAAGEQGA